jgi:Aspartyl protease
MTNIKGFVSLVVLATAVVTTLGAETHCPGNVASVPFRVVNRHQIIVAVSVNKSGPYDFLLDTGTQITIVDRSLATELHLSNHGAAVVAGSGFNESASLTQVDYLAAGSHSLADREVVVYDLDRLHSADLRVRGILGEDFLGHFDMLIDNSHSLLCLDDSAAMRSNMKGEHIDLLTPVGTTGGKQLPRSLIVVAHLSAGIRPVRLKLDSGANVAFLYDISQYMALGSFRGASLHGAGADGTLRTFSALPPQDVKIGSLELAKVLFVTLAGAQKDRRTSDFDGLLTLGLFRRVFIAHADHFAIFDPK